MPRLRPPAVGQPGMMVAPQDEDTWESRGRKLAAPPSPPRASALPRAAAAAVVAAHVAPVVAAAGAVPLTIAAAAIAVVAAPAAHAASAAPVVPLTMLLFLFPPPPLLLLLILPLLLLLDGMKPNGPRHPPLETGSLGPLVRGMIACRVRTAPRFITNSDRVALTSRLGQLGGSIPTLGARCFISARGRQDGF